LAARLNLFELTFAICAVTFPNAMRESPRNLCRPPASLTHRDRRRDVPHLTLSVRHQNVFFWTRLKAQPSLPVTCGRVALASKGVGQYRRACNTVVGGRRAGGIPQLDVL